MQAYCLSECDDIEIFFGGGDLLPPVGFSETTISLYQYTRRSIP
jgi:hypothetical protein